MASRCTAVITASPYYVSELRTLYRASNVTVIRNVPSYKSVSHNDRLRQYLGLGPEVRIALYQGNIQEDRGLDRLVLAAKFLEPDIVIVMMGGASKSVDSQLRALIASEEVADRVKILPAVSYAELLDWTASADIGLTIFPLDYSLSRRLSLPNKLFEYLMAGRPVLSSQVDAIVEIIETHDVGQIVSSVVPSDIGDAINAMLRDPVALARMHTNALEVAKREFYWEKECHKLIDLYTNLLSERRTYSNGSILRPKS
jgi:glycosyltransferase involved in cell wall biosynthesis